MGKRGNFCWEVVCLVIPDDKLKSNYEIAMAIEMHYRLFLLVGLAFRPDI